MPPGVRPLPRLRAKTARTGASSASDSTGAKRYPVARRRPQTASTAAWGRRAPGDPRLPSPPDMQVNRTDTVMVCRSCERTLLLGERATYYRSDVQEVPVCPLCADEADARGWLRAGAPSPPPVESVAVRGPGLMTRVLDSLRRSGPE